VRKACLLSRDLWSPSSCYLPDTDNAVRQDALLCQRREAGESWGKAAAPRNTLNHPFHIIMAAVTFLLPAIRCPHGLHPLSRTPSHTHARIQYTPSRRVSRRNLRRAGPRLFPCFATHQNTVVPVRLAHVRGEHNKLGASCPAQRWRTGPRRSVNAWKDCQRAWLDGGPFPGDQNLEMVRMKIRMVGRSKVPTRQHSRGMCAAWLISLKLPDDTAWSDMHKSGRSIGSATRRRYPAPYFPMLSLRAPSNRVIWISERVNQRRVGNGQMSERCSPTVSYFCPRSNINSVSCVPPWGCSLPGMLFPFTSTITSNIA
jgi:hypothetical protein